MSKNKSVVKTRKNGCANNYHSKDMCVRCYNKEYSVKNSHIAIIRAKAWYRNNKDLKKKYDKDYNVKNRKKKNTQNLIWVSNNKQKRKEICKKDYETNKGRCFAHAANNRAVRVKAMPKWLSTEQKQQIRMIYENRPAGYHVDHIVPLKGKHVSGLHVPWNLQYLPAKANFQKGNRF